VEEERDLLTLDNGKGGKGGKRRAGSGKKRSDYWVTQRYTVRPEIVEEILGKLEVEPKVDVFADEGAHVLPRWWGRGGERKDAWKESWDFSMQGHLWMNPPFGQLKEVAHKILGDGARVVLVCPNWPREVWWKKLKPFVVDEVWYPRGTKFFTRDGKVMQGTKWGVHAYLVDGTVGFTERVVNMLQKKREVCGKSQINMFKLGEGNKVEKEEDERIQG